MIEIRRFFISKKLIKLILFTFYKEFKTLKLNNLHVYYTQIMLCFLIMFNHSKDYPKMFGRSVEKVYLRTRKINLVIL